MEIWKDIEEYEEIYQISNFGKVKSKDFFRNGKSGYLKKYKGKLLKGHINNLGYLCFDLYKDGFRKNIKSHSLVAFHFVHGYKKGLWVNHVDGNKQNNHFSNLEWCTAKQNSIHAFDTRLIVKKGEIVLHLITGIFYESIRQAHRSGLINCSRSQFQKQLRGNLENKTFFKVV
jgi:hypothetical protein